MMSVRDMHRGHYQDRLRTIIAYCRLLAGNAAARGQRVVDELLQLVLGFYVGSVWIDKQIIEDLGVDWRR